MGVRPLTTERVTRCFGVAAAHTYYAEGVMGGEAEEEEEEERRMTELSAGPCDYSGMWRDGGPRNRVAACVHSSVSVRRLQAFLLLEL